MWAALTRLIAQAQGVTRLGNINPRLYELGNLLNPALGLHDITIGNNDDNGIKGYDADRERGTVHRSPTRPAHRCSSIVLRRAGQRLT